MELLWQPTFVQAQAFVKGKTREFSSALESCSKLCSSSFWDQQLCVLDLQIWLNCRTELQIFDFNCKDHIVRQTCSMLTIRLGFFMSFYFNKKWLSVVNISLLTNFQIVHLLVLLTKTKHHLCSTLSWLPLESLFFRPHAFCNIKSLCSRPEIMFSVKSYGKIKSRQLREICVCPIQLLYSNVRHAYVLVARRNWETRQRVKILFYWEG